MISIIIPTYNYAHTIVRALDSVINQTEDASEVIVVDDGSTDNTQTVLAEYCFDHPQVKVIHQSNAGPAAARNRGIHESKGDFLIFLDADDELVPDAVRSFSRQVESDPSVGMVVGAHWALFEDGRKKLIKPGDMPSDVVQRLRCYLLDKTLAISNGATMVARRVFENGLYPEGFRSAEDIPIFAQALSGFACMTFNEPVAIIHKHGDSLRHQFSHAKAGGLGLVEEIFAVQRVGSDVQTLKADFYAQRCLSLFRSAYLAKDREAAKDYYSAALRHNWRLLFKTSYTRKAIRLWLGKS